MQIWTSFQSTLLGDWIKSMKSQTHKFFIKAAEENASMCKANEFYKEFVFVQTNRRITSIPNIYNRVWRLSIRGTKVIQNKKGKSQTFPLQLLLNHCKVIFLLVCLFV